MGFFHLSAKPQSDFLNENKRRTRLYVPYFSREYNHITSREFTLELLETKNVYVLDY